jgi:hypothetical protein
VREQHGRCKDGGWTGWGPSLSCDGLRRVTHSREGAVQWSEGGHVHAKSHSGARGSRGQRGTSVTQGDRAGEPTGEEAVRARRP